MPSPFSRHGLMIVANVLMALLNGLVWYHVDYAFSAFVCGACTMAAMTWYVLFLAESKAVALEKKIKDIEGTD